MRGRIARKIYKRLSNREACLAGGCQGWLNNGNWWWNNERCHKCKYSKDVAWKVKYPKGVQYHIRMRRIAERCYTQYYICLRIWDEMARKYQTPRPPLRVMVEVAMQRYKWTERKASICMSRFYIGKMFKNIKNKDYD